MNESSIVLALGLMSGTSLDGIDAALLRTDGDRQVEPGLARSFPYTRAFRERLRRVLGGRDPVAEVERELTQLHAEAVAVLLAEARVTPAEVDVIGFHGHTILHEPHKGRTWQIGDGALLAQQTGIGVVADFRSQDVAAGGEGAPFAPLFQAALADDLEKPVAVLNIGGVANVTWIGECNGEDMILAFDTGPGNALLNDWMERLGGEPLDRDGALAGQGRVDGGVLASMLENAYFARRPPKSLDRDDFGGGAAAGLAAADGAATLTAFTAAAVARSLEHVPALPRRWLVTGGGRHNPVMMQELASRLGAVVAPVEAVGWNGDALEAQAFAYLAVRSRLGLPLSLPTTTGVGAPCSGGRWFPA